LDGRQPIDSVLGNSVTRHGQPSSWTGGREWWEVETSWGPGRGQHGAALASLPETRFSRFRAFGDATPARHGRWIRPAVGRTLGPEKNIEIADADIVLSRERPSCGASSHPSCFSAGHVRGGPIALSRGPPWPRPMPPLQSQPHTQFNADTPRRKLSAPRTLLPRNAQAPGRRTHRGSLATRQSGL